MKISSLLLSVAIATSSSTLVLAAECTTDDLTAISNLYNSAMSDGTAACPDVTAANDATSANYCTSDCLEFMTNMLDELPDCSSGGVNMRAGMQAAIDYCETGTADTSDVLTGSTGTAGSSSLRSGSSTSNTAESTKVTADTVPPAAGSSMASSTGITVSSVLFAVTVFGVAGL
ncbi:hypothetical protein F441_09338 [Phytophthora nicotianae CJ01A1]|uniref:Elicitin n=4 Tax=Phytophthora nicotianae TaxID=4792 RepID=W2ZAI0_PHYNI|nr:hypothetical protein L915_09197 [Phytophthora nicotianae]ETP16015.1 hypothetical protein F441_09338 [Phytophthora nicotianae CJ01A1]ETP44085.1 hypothetical protein F442_09299 [Phytophthora nicotianae P10297]KUF98130.1 hypothetical protein AM588_10007473 [Phytophthora nicotianae]ETL39577.1 hypothetical protein L916_09110 [Phytophthora nicotianae]